MSQLHRTTWLREKLERSVNKWLVGSPQKVQPQPRVFLRVSLLGEFSTSSKLFSGEFRTCAKIWGRIKSSKNLTLPETDFWKGSFNGSHGTVGRIKFLMQILP